MIKFHYDHICANVVKPASWSTRYYVLFFGKTAVYFLQCKKKKPLIVGMATPYNDGFIGVLLYNPFKRLNPRTCLKIPQVLTA